MTVGNQAFLESLCRQNTASYGTNDGRGLLELARRSFEHRWIYLFELLQNALDCQSKSVRFVRSDSELIVEHDGKTLEQPHVESLSKVAQSTKGAATVGFMGVGFKSVFGRFRHVGISAEGWRIRFDVEEQLGQLGERTQTSWAWCFLGGTMTSSLQLHRLPHGFASAGRGVRATLKLTCCTHR